MPDMTPELARELVEQNLLWERSVYERLKPGCVRDKQADLVAALQYHLELVERLEYVAERAKAMLSWYRETYPYDVSRVACELSDALDDLETPHDQA